MSDLTNADVARLTVPETATHIRKSAGFTQPEFAAIMGISRATLIRWENGQKGPAPSRRRIWAATLAAHKDLALPTPITPDIVRILDERLARIEIALGIRPEPMDDLNPPLDDDPTQRLANDVQDDEFPEMLGEIISQRMAMLLGRELGIWQRPVSSLQGTSWKRLAGLRNFGARSLDELINALWSNGIDLSSDGELSRDESLRGQTQFGRWASIWKEDAA